MPNPKLKYTPEVIANWIRKIDAGLATKESIADQAGIKTYEVTRRIKEFNKP